MIGVVIHIGERQDGDGGSFRQRRPCRYRFGRRFRVGHRGQLIATTGIRDDPAVTERFAERRHMNLEIVLFDGKALPDLVEQRGFSNGLTGRGSEYQENVQCSAADWHRDAIAGQASAASIEPERPEQVILLAGRRHRGPMIQDY